MGLALFRWLHAWLAHREDWYMDISAGMHLNRQHPWRHALLYCLNQKKGMPVDAWIPFQIPQGLGVPLSYLLISFPLRLQSPLSTSSSSNERHLNIAFLPLLLAPQSPLLTLLDCHPNLLYWLSLIVILNLLCWLSSIVISSIDQWIKNISLDGIQKTSLSIVQTW